MSWRRRPTNSRSSARVTPRAVEATLPVELSALTDRRRRRSQGVVVEASVLARLLGLRLLRLDATVVLVPADVSSPSSASYELPARASARSAPVPPARSEVVGGRLAHAVRSIDEGAELLAEARRESPRCRRKSRNHFGEPRYSESETPRVPLSRRGVGTPARTASSCAAKASPRNSATEVRNAHSSTPIVPASGP